MIDKNGLTKTVFMLAIIALAGCQTASDAIDSVTSSNTEPETTQLAQLQLEPTDGTCGGDSAFAVRLAEVDYGLGIVRDAGLDTYVNGVLAKLVAASPRPDCRVRAMVIPNNDLTTVATADGGILLPLGLLRELKSEDELAAILGHEFSHILLRHHESDSFVSTQDEIVKGIDALYGAHAMFSGLTGTGGDLGNTKTIANVVYQVSESVIAPAWTREQEDEADLLGSDLTAEAGYNPTAMGKIMDILTAYEKQQAERAELRENMQDEDFRDSVYKSFFNPTTSGQETFELESILANFGSLAISSAGSIFGDETHRPAEERKELVTAYVREFHRKTRRRAFEEATFEAATTTGETGIVLSRMKLAAESRRLAFAGNLDTAETYARQSVAGVTETASYPRLAFYEVRKLQGNANKAAQNLDLALRSEQAPWSVYRNRATLSLEAGDATAALRTVEAADRRFNQPVTILPFAISVHKANGQDDRVSELLLRCRQEGTREFYSNCAASAGIDSGSEVSDEGTPDASGFINSLLGN